MTTYAAQAARSLRQYNHAAKGRNTIMMTLTVDQSLLIDAGNASYRPYLICQESGPGDADRRTTDCFQLPLKSLCDASATVSAGIQTPRERRIICVSNNQARSNTLSMREREERDSQYIRLPLINLALRETNIQPVFSREIRLGCFRWRLDRRPIGTVPYYPCTSAARGRPATLCV